MTGIIRFIARAGRAAGILAALSLPQLAGAAHVQAAPGGPVLLPQGGLSGQQAVDAIGTRMATVASANGRTPSAITALLLKDPTLKVDRFGWLYYDEDQALVPATLPAASPAGSLPMDLSATFRLHSLPDAKAKLYLNFVGGRITDTAWNQSLGQSLIVFPGFDTDGNPASWSDAERRTIQAVWQRVAEDLAPFNIDVTTEAGPVPANGYVSTMMITRDPGFAAGSSGLAYASRFKDAALGPGLVFSDRLRGNDKFIAEAISHLVGHRLGLDHDGTATAVQYAGHAGWAPIMGRSYSATITQFSKGGYAGATNLQDDFALMASAIAYRADAGDGPDTAAELLEWGDSDRYTRDARGGIEKPGDADYYAIAAGNGPITARLQHQTLGANAELILSLMDDSGRVLRSARLSATSNRSADLISYPNQTPGTYYLRVTAAGLGDVATTGFSDYGSRGLYSLSVSFPSAHHKPPVASIALSGRDIGIAPLSVQVDGRNGDTAGVVRYVWDLGNGSTSYSPNPTATFAAAGQYRIKLKVIDRSGFSASTSRLVVAGRELQQPRITVDVRPQVVRRPDGSMEQLFMMTYRPAPFADAGGQLLPTGQLSMRFGNPASAQELLSLPAIAVLPGANLLGFTSTTPCFTIRLFAVVSGSEFYFPPRDTTVQTCRDPS